MLNSIYKYSPVFLQNSYISAYGYYWKHRRYGGVFKEKLVEFKAREQFSKEQWDKYQTHQLRKLLIHAFSTVPFYTKLYKKHGFSLSDFKKFNLSDLSKLPFLEKDDLRKYGTTSLLSSEREKGRFYNSSGSTGTPVKIYFSKKFHQTWSALYEARVRNWAGVNYKLPRAMIGGRRVLPSSIMKPPYYRYNLAEHQIYLSAYHIAENTTKDYVSGLTSKNVKYLVGYALSIYLLAKHINKLKIDAPKLRAVLTSSEKLTPTMRNTIANAFKCKVYDAYSGVEACGLISENNTGELLFSPDSGIMELVDNNGNPINNGESGEVIATGLLNFNQPLIRYRIGDTITLSKSQKNSSQTNMPKITEIEGRTEDVIIGLNGQKMVRFHSIFNGIASVVMAQVIQNSLTEIQINMVVDDTFQSNIETIIEQRIQSQLGAVNILFNYVDTIEKTASGKYKSVISKISYEQ